MNELKNKYTTTILTNTVENTLLIEALFEGKGITDGFYFSYDKFVHAHLSETLIEYLNLSIAI